MSERSAQNVFFKCAIELGQRFGEARPDDKATDRDNKGLESIPDWFDVPLPSNNEDAMFEVGIYTIRMREVVRMAGFSPINDQIGEFHALCRIEHISPH